MERCFLGYVALDLLRLGPVLDLNVVDGLVDTALLAAQNFGAKPYNPDDGSWKRAAQQEQRERANLMKEQYRLWEYELYPQGSKER